MSKQSPMEDLRDEVEEEGGVMTTVMYRLRDAYGKARLGPHVCEAISSELAKVGLGHYPRKLPEHQDRPVRLYRKGSPVGRVIEAALAPGTGRDEILREAAGIEAAVVLQQIRELVCS